MVTRRSQRAAGRWSRSSCATGSRRPGRRRNSPRRAPANPDEQHRLDAYEAARARLAARQIKLPRCTLGEASVFDGDDTYAQLKLEVDPPEVMTQAHRIVELMHQHCR